ncbi:MAG: bifunctional glutamate N-acetyltransferase/amino-acid acetyltransferase ArgJ [Acidobacteria bacterium]|nr:bifunctional glutamate N-acetyltransferase/amino-acid acetyltransferase ArgJ [Acidobacteriota bacterium]
MNLPLGYRYASTYAGIRKAEKDDLALIVSDTTASAAAVFTRNLVQAAPVRLSRAHLRASRGRARAILVNAGNANCATRTGDRVALATSRAAARLLKVPVEQVLPSSTGVIGVELNPKLITAALPALVAKLSPEAFTGVANAILTTDLKPKIAFADLSIGGGTVHLAGLTKGSGMIHPNMATTLGYLMTDAAISPRDLQPLLAAATNRTYNRLSVDGDTSTNDTVVLLANGASGLKPNADDRAMFQEALTWVMQDLVEQIARDGEGASHQITIHVSGARTEDDAARVARVIANSPLVKTAIAGSDPNWGRILSAAGNAGVPFDPAKVDISLQGIPVCRNGLAARFDEAALAQKLKASACRIRFLIQGPGRGEARFWTCDLTKGYIDINASYRT